MKKQNSFSKEKLNKLNRLAAKSDWFTLSHMSPLPEDFVDKYKDKLDWHLLCELPMLEGNPYSEEFLMKFKDYIPFSVISWYPNFGFALSEDFIREFADKVDWLPIAQYPEFLSKEFREEFKYQLESALISNNVIKHNSDCCLKSIVNRI